MATYDNGAAKRGQAINLAVHDALKNDLENNPRYIYTKYIYYSTLAEMMQSSSVEDIKEVLNSPKLDQMIKDLEEIFK